MSRIPVAILWALLAGSLLGAQAPTSPTTEPATRKEDLTSEEILKEYVRRSKAGEKVNVSAAETALCPVCKKPLYKHSDDGFVCKIPDEFDDQGNLIRSVLREMPTLTVTCPVCKAPFKATEKGNINDKAGRDRDFCPHSVGRYAVHSSVWMCPECGYAAESSVFTKQESVKPEVVQFVQQNLSSKTHQLILDLTGLTGVDQEQVRPDRYRFASYIEQSMLPDWAKYENALKLIEAGLVQLPHGVKARLYCEAAHACRRFVASEVSVALEDQRLQISLGQSARRVNDWLLAECLKVREDRAEGKKGDQAEFIARLNAYTQKPETDPQILLGAAIKLDRKIEEILRLESQENNPDKPTQITRLDQYVFHMRYAGILDRIGALDDAITQLEKAQNVIPKGAPSMGQTGPIEAEAKAFMERLLASLRNSAATRIDLIRKERQFLFNAANHLLQALYFGEQARNLDPAMNCYLIGELLRRSEGEPAAAYACFQASKELFAKIDPAKVKPEIPVGTPVEKAQAILTHAQENEQIRKDVMMQWADQQMSLVKEKAAGHEPEQRVRDTIARILSGRIGEPAVSATTPDIRIPDTQPANTATNQSSATHTDATPTTVATPKGLTRETVLKAYYEAFQAYEKQNGAIPKKLSDLVEAGLLKQPDACQDAEGRLVCPETGHRLIYVQPGALGTHTPMILSSSKDPNRMRLYADGQVGEK